MRTEWSDKFRHISAIALDVIAEMYLECLKAGAGRVGAAVELSDLVRMGADVSLPRVANEPAYLYRQRISQAWDYWVNAGSDYGASLLFSTLGPADMLARYITPNLTGTFAIETYTSADWPDLDWTGKPDAVRVVVITPVQAGLGSARVNCNGGFVIGSYSSNTMPGLAWLVPYNLPPHSRLMEKASSVQQTLGFADSRTRMWAQRTNNGLTWDSEDGLPWDDGTGESSIVFTGSYVTEFPDTLRYFPFLLVAS